MEIESFKNKKNNLYIRPSVKNFCLFKSRLLRIYHNSIVIQYKRIENSTLLATALYIDYVLYRAD